MPRIALHWQILIAMILGSGGGLLLNGTASVYEASARRENEENPLARLLDSTDRIEIDLYGTDKRGRPVASIAKQIVVDGSMSGDEIEAFLRDPNLFYVSNLDQLAASREHADAHDAYAAYVKSMQNARDKPAGDPQPGPPRPASKVDIDGEHVEITLYKLDAQGAGSADVRKRVVVDPSLSPAKVRRLLHDPNKVHFRALQQFADSTENARAYKLFQDQGRSWARYIGDSAKVIGDIFLRLLKMVSIPLIITSLVTGITGLGNAQRLGKMFGRTLLYYVATSLLAITTGLFMVNMIRPGAQPVAAQVVADDDDQDEKSLGTVLFEQFENMIPPNPIASAAEGNFLSIIAFSLLIGIFTIIVGGQTAEIIARLFQAFFDVMMSMTMAIIRLAPYGVFFMMLSATATQGAGIFGMLGKYMLTVFLALVFHACITLPLILRFLARRNPRQFANAMSPALLTAFSSASSNGTLPLTMTSAERRAGVSNRVTSFVLPLGATINMDGTALYEVVAVLFIAQFTGHDLTLAQQIIVAFTALLASIGAAGIPHAGLVMMVIILQAVGLPTETQGLIIAVDRVLDMGRTSVNVWSDSCGCAVIARFEAAPDATDNGKGDATDMASGEGAVEI